MTLEQFAITVAIELKKYNIDVILTGGAVVSIYSVGKDFYHDDTEYSVEFPGSQLVIGNSPMKPDGKIERKGFTLRLLSPTQCVMDRLAAFYHWRDRQSLDQALLVAQNHPIKIKIIEDWSKSEGEENKFNEFLNKLEEIKRKKK